MKRTCLSLLSSLVLCLPLVAQAQLTTVISDYPQYGTQLNPAQLADLRRVAQAAAGALLVGSTLSVIVYGHADFDRNPGVDVVKVSRDRAAQAKADLQRLVREEVARVLLPPDRADSVQYSEIAMGTSRPVVPESAPMDQRVANRRVEFAWTVVPPAPQPATSVYQRCVNVLASASPPGPVRRMTCACNKFLQQSFVADTYYDFRASRYLIPGSAGWPSLSPLEWQAAISGFVKHLKGDINSVANGSDADFQRGLLLTDDNVGRNINDFYSQQNAGAATGLFDQAIIADIQSRMASPNHFLSCYAGYSRANHDR